MSEKALITQKGREKLVDEINNLAQVERPKVTKAISDARELGDLSENAEYSAAKEKQRVIDARIRFLQSIESNSQVINIADIKNTNVIHFGATVTYKNLLNDKINTVTLLSEYESDASNNLISVRTPIGSALLGKEKGDIVDLELNGSFLEIEVLKIE